MATPQPNSLFPAEIGAVPRSEWIPQRFGWAPAGLGILAIAVFCETLFRPDLAGNMIRDLDWPWLSRGVLRGGLLVFGPLLLTWEFRRRARRTVLVPRNGMVAIYHNFNFVVAIRPGEIKPYILRPRTTAIMVLAAISSLVLLTAGVLNNDAGPGWILLALALFTGFSSASFTRIGLQHRMVTTRSPIIKRVIFKEANRNVHTEMFDQLLMLRKAEANRIPH